MSYKEKMKLKLKKMKDKKLLFSPTNEQYY